MNEGKQTSKGAVEPPSGGLKLTDIYYVLFRQKWWIIIGLIAGIVTAGLMYTSQKPQYSSEAKLLVRYVVETAAEAGLGAQSRSVGNATESIINSEFQILTSLDLCEDVAAAVGADRILGSAGGSNNMAAAMAIRDGLTVENPPRSTIIVVRFTHSDPSICPVVLSQLIESYYLRHKAVHRDPREFDNVLFEYSQTLLGKIRQNEEKLRRLKSEAGIISIEDARKSLSEQSTKLRQELFSAQAQVAEYKSILGGQKQDEANKEKEVEKPAPSREKVAEYTSLRGRIDSLRNREFDLLLNFTEENPQVVRLREQIAINERRQKALEAEFPKLPSLYFGTPSAVNNQLDPNRVAALESRIEAITNQLNLVRTNITQLDNLDSQVTDIQRSLEVDQVNYKHATSGFEAARFDEALSGVKASNIQYVQKASPPSMNVTKKFKQVGGAFFGLLFAGIGFAFLIEMFVDHSVRRPADFENKLKIPLFLSIPKLKFNGHAKMLPFPARAIAAVAGESAGANLNPTWEDEHPLRAYIDGLRDSTLTYFGADPHKPKLIGVTGCKDGSGVTSLAAGLAGALSETGDGNVLLLNLNLEGQAVHPFYRGELACDLNEALESDKRQNGMVLQNLYVATAGNPSDPSTTNLSKQLARVVPKLRVSDYDYIVFDLPPTTPTTMTARLAGMMDLVILVVESEKDSQDTVKQATRLLARSQAKVSAVLNKVRNPVPRWLHKGV